MFEYSDYDSWEAYDDWLHRHDEPRPRCAYCGRTIEEPYAFEFDNGMVCEECVDEYVQENFRRPL